MQTRIDTSEKIPPQPRVYRDGHAINLENICRNRLSSLRRNKAQNPDYHQDVRFEDLEGIYQTLISIAGHWQDTDIQRKEAILEMAVQIKAEADVLQVLKIKDKT